MNKKIKKGIDKRVENEYTYKAVKETAKLFKEKFKRNKKTLNKK
ncbi:hypothetical protein [Anaerosphaera aminiphila]|nr:hypothetical protein [Anaerosphaera aminiphila]